MEKLQTLLWLSFLVVANIEVCPGGGSRLCRWSSKCRHKFTYWTTNFKSRTEKVKETFLILHFLDRSLTVYRLVGNRTDLCEEAIAEQYWAALLFIGNFSDFAEHRFIGKLSDCGLEWIEQQQRRARMSGEQRLLRKWSVQSAQTRLKSWNEGKDS